MTLYESLIKVDVHADERVRLRDIVEGLHYTAVLLIDEYGLTLNQVTDALDEARQCAEDEWYNLHPSESEL